MSEDERDSDDDGKLVVRPSYIGLKRSRVSFESLSRVFHDKRISTLDLRKSNLNDTTLRGALSALMQNKTLRVLDISETSVSAWGFIELVDCLSGFAFTSLVDSSSTPNRMSNGPLSLVLPSPEGGRYNGVSGYGVSSIAQNSPLMGLFSNSRFGMKRSLATVHPYLSVLRASSTDVLNMRSLLQSMCQVALVAGDKLQGAASHESKTPSADDDLVMTKSLTSGGHAMDDIPPLFPFNFDENITVSSALKPLISSNSPFLTGGVPSEKQADLLLSSSTAAAITASTRMASDAQLAGIKLESVELTASDAAVLVRLALWCVLAMLGAQSPILRSGEGRQKKDCTRPLPRSKKPAPISKRSKPPQLPAVSETPSSHAEDSSDTDMSFDEAGSNNTQVYGLGSCPPDFALRGLDLCDTGINQGILAHMSDTVLDARRTSTSSNPSQGGDVKLDGAADQLLDARGSRLPALVALRIRSADNDTEMPAGRFTKRLDTMLAENARDLVARTIMLSGSKSDYTAKRTASSFFGEPALWLRECVDLNPSLLDALPAGTLAPYFSDNDSFHAGKASLSSSRTNLKESILKSTSKSPYESASSTANSKQIEVDELAAALCEAGLSIEGSNRQNFSIYDRPNETSAPNARQDHPRLSGRKRAASRGHRAAPWGKNEKEKAADGDDSDVSSDEAAGPPSPQGKRRSAAQRREYVLALSKRSVTIDWSSKMMISEQSPYISEVGGDPRTSSSGHRKTTKIVYEPEDDDSSSLVVNTRSEESVPIPGTLKAYGTQTSAIDIQRGSGRRCESGHGAGIEDWTAVGPTEEEIAALYADIPDNNGVLLKSENDGAAGIRKETGTSGIGATSGSIKTTGRRPQPPSSQKPAAAMSAQPTPRLKDAALEASTAAAERELDSRSLAMEHESSTTKRERAVGADRYGQTGTKRSSAEIIAAAAIATAAPPPHIDGVTRRDSSSGRAGKNIIAVPVRGRPSSGPPALQVALGSSVAARTTGGLSSSENGNAIWTANANSVKVSDHSASRPIVSSASAAAASRADRSQNAATLRLVSASVKSMVDTRPPPKKATQAFALQAETLSEGTSSTSKGSGTSVSSRPRGVSSSPANGQVTDSALAVSAIRAAR